MLSVPTCPSIPSNKKFHIILFMRKNGEIINFKDQDIYNHNISFKRAMRDLHRKKLVMIKQLRTGNLYRLTDMGRALGLILDEITK